MSTVEVTLKTIEDKEVIKTMGDLGVQATNESAIVEEALGLGKKGNVLKRYKELRDLEKHNCVLTLDLSLDQEAVKTILVEECEPHNVEAIDATLTRSGGAFSVTQGVTGLLVDVSSSLKKIEETIKNEWNREPVVIDMVVIVDEPRGKTDELLMVKDLLGSFHTSYSSSGTSRSGNVTNGTRLINGITLYPGDSFSTYEVVSPFTEANGYYMAGSYLNGMVVDSLGGGICQVSTTLYNAVLRAELEVTERFNHSMIVSYVDPSADAAIAGTYKDFKFTNNYDYPIYIEGYTSSDKVITFNIYGVENRPSNRTVTYESEVISTKVPETEKIVADSSKPVGFINVQSAHIGYVAKLWKVVKEDGVEVSRTVVNNSNYMASPRTASVGTATGDPNIQNIMNAAIATGSIDYVKATVSGLVAAANQAAQQAVQQ